MSKKNVVVGLLVVLLSAAWSGTSQASPARSGGKEAGFSYHGKFSATVKYLLNHDQCPTWSTGSNDDGSPLQPPKFLLRNDGAIRDTYIAAATNQAWAAEAYARTGKNDQAEDVAIEMVSSLREAAKLCSDGVGVVESSKPEPITSYITCEWLTGGNFDGASESTDKENDGTINNGGRGANNNRGDSDTGMISNDPQAARALSVERDELMRREARDRLQGLTILTENEAEDEMEDVRKDTADQLQGMGQEAAALGGFMGMLNQININKRKQKEEERRQFLIRQRAALNKMRQATEQHSVAERNLLNAYSPEAIQKALAEGATLEIVDARGHSPLVKAALGHRFAAVNYLLEQGANSNYSGISTPLQIVTGYDLQMALVLCLNGANPDIAKWGDTPSVTSKKQKLHLFEFLFKDIKTENSQIRQKLTAAPKPTEGAVALNAIVIDGNLDLMKNLLDEGVPVDAPNEYSWTPLMQAAQYGNTHLVKELLARGANIDAVNVFGQTPLAVAWSAGYGSEIGPLLIANGANVKIKDIAGKTVSKSVQEAPEWMEDKEFLKLLKLAEKNPSEAIAYTGITPIKRSQQPALTTEN